MAPKRKIGKTPEAIRTNKVWRRVLNQTPNSTLGGSSRANRSNRSASEVVDIADLSILECSQNVTRTSDSELQPANTVSQSELDLLTTPSAKAEVAVICNKLQSWLDSGWKRHFDLSDDSLELQFSNQDTLPYITERRRKSLLQLESFKVWSLPCIFGNDSSSLLVATERLENGKTVLNVLDGSLRLQILKEVFHLFVSQEDDSPLLPHKQFLEQTVLPDCIHQVTVLIVPSKQEEDAERLMCLLPLIRVQSLHESFGQNLIRDIEIIRTVADELNLVCKRKNKHLKKSSPRLAPTLAATMINLGYSVAYIRSAMSPLQDIVNIRDSTVDVVQRLLAETFISDVRKVFDNDEERNEAQKLDQLRWLRFLSADYDRSMVYWNTEREESLFFRWTIPFLLREIAASSSDLPSGNALKGPYGNDCETEEDPEKEVEDCAAAGSAPTEEVHDCETEENDETKQDPEKEVEDCAAAGYAPTEDVLYAVNDKSFVEPHLKTTENDRPVSKKRSRRLRSSHAMSSDIKVGTTPLSLEAEKPQMVEFGNSEADCDAPAQEQVEKDQDVATSLIGERETDSANRNETVILSTPNVEYDSSQTPPNPNEPLTISTPPQVSSDGEVEYDSPQTPANLDRTFRTAVRLKKSVLDSINEPNTEDVNRYFKNWPLSSMSTTVSKRWRKDDDLSETVCCFVYGLQYSKLSDVLSEAGDRYRCHVTKSSHRNSVICLWIRRELADQPHFGNLFRLNTLNAFCYNPDAPAGRQAEFTKPKYQNCYGPTPWIRSLVTLVIMPVQDFRLLHTMFAVKPALEWPEALEKKRLCDLLYGAEQHVLHRLWFMDRMANHRVSLGDQPRTIEWLCKELAKYGKLCFDEGSRQHMNEFYPAFRSWFHIDTETNRDPNSICLHNVQPKDETMD